MAEAGLATLSDPADSDAEALFHLAELRLRELLPPNHSGESDALFSASSAALLGRGKRARPILTMLACAHVGGQARWALDYGCAVEMVHAASLAIDDLPCMDDATLRRGLPAVHVAHGEDAAVLASIALLNQAHRTILEARSLSAELRLGLLDELTRAVGFDGLAHGQMRDLRDDANARTEATLRRLNHLKTGRLMVAALRGGAMIGGARDSQLEALTRFGESIGFAFQLCDDLLDATSTTDVLGKDVAQDRDKLTFVDVWGEGRVRRAIRQAVERAEDAVGVDEAVDMRLADYVRDLLLNAAAAR